MSCCTENAWGELKNPDYKEKGIVEKVDDLEIYRVGSSSKCIIWCYDVFGFKVRISAFLERLFATQPLDKNLLSNAIKFIKQQYTVSFLFTSAKYDRKLFLNKRNY